MFFQRSVFLYCRKPIGGGRKGCWKLGRKIGKTGILENFLSIERQFRGAHFGGSYLSIQRLSGKSALMVRQRVCKGREKWSQLAGKPPDEGEKLPESWLVNQLFSVGWQAAPAGWHAAVARPATGHVGQPAHGQTTCRFGKFQFWCLKFGQFCFNP